MFRYSSFVRTAFIAAVLLSLCSAADARHPRELRGAFPLLVTPYDSAAALDREVLVREAAFVDREGAGGVIWPTAVEIELLDSLGEYRLGLEALAREWKKNDREPFLTAVCCGRDQESALRRIEMWSEIAARECISAAILGRLPDNIRTEAEMEDYFRAVARVTRLPFIIQTDNSHSPQPPVELLIRLAKDYPEIYGYIKEESGNMPLTDERMAGLDAGRPWIKTIISGYGATGFLFQGPAYGARGVITQKPDCTRLLAKMCQRAAKGTDASDPQFADAFGKMLIMANLNIHFATKETFRGPHLVILRELGVFDNTYSRKRKPGGGFTVEEFTVTDTQLQQIRDIIRLIYR